MSLASSLAEDYFRRTGKPNASALDAAYAYQWAVLRDLMERLEIILADEGIAPDVIRRVLRSLLYGSPSAVDAELRMEQDKRLAEALAKVPPMPASLEGLGLPPR